MGKDQSEKPIFQEWQLPSSVSFIPHTLVFPSIWLVLAPINAELGLFLGVSLTILSIAIRLATSKRIRVTATVLEVGAASIPRIHLGSAEVVIESEQFSEKGPKLKARAFLALKESLESPFEPRPQCWGMSRWLQKWLLARGKA